MCRDATIALCMTVTTYHADRLFSALKLLHEDKVTILVYLSLLCHYISLNVTGLKLMLSSARSVCDPFSIYECIRIFVWQFYITPFPASFQRLHKKINQLYIHSKNFWVVSTC